MVPLMFTTHMLEVTEMHFTWFRVLGYLFVETVMIGFMLIQEKQE
jgi:hypothetical protein